MVALRTPRGVLRPLTLADRDALHALWTGTGVRRYLWDDERIPIGRTIDIIARSERMFGESGFGLWGAHRHHAAGLAGFCGLWPFREAENLELLYGVAEDLWGQSYAAEWADAVIGYCFDRLDMPVVRASTDAANAASVRVLEKLRFQMTRRAMIGGLDTLFYERLRAPALDDAAFLSAFEACALDEFHHRDHVRVAWLYLRAYPLLTAIDRFTTGVKRFAASKGKSEIYHETITLAYLLLMHERIARDGDAGTWDDFAAANADLLSRSPSILERYYLKATLDSDVARRTFVLPDLLR